MEIKTFLISKLSLCSQIRKKVWRSGRVLECNSEDIGSRSGDVTFRQSISAEEVRHLKNFVEKVRYL